MIAMIRCWSLKMKNRIEVSKFESYFFLVIVCVGQEKVMKHTGQKDILDYIYIKLTN